MPFAIPMVRREGKYHIMICYFCRINLKGINCKNKHHLQYHDVPSAIRPIPHSPDFPVPKPDGIMEYSSSESEHSNMTVIAGDDAYKIDEDDQSEPLTQAELNDLTRDVNLSNEFTQLLGSRLKGKYLFAPETTFFRYRDREREFFHVPG